MSLMKAVKWFAICVLLTLGFVAATALATFLFVRVVMPYRYGFGTLFFFFLFLAGMALVAMGVLNILQVPKLTLPEDGCTLKAYQRSQFRTERKYGTLLILIGLTFIFVSLTQF